MTLAASLGELDSQLSDLRSKRNQLSSALGANLFESSFGSDGSAILERADKSSKRHPQYVNKTVHAYESAPKVEPSGIESVRSLSESFRPTQAKNTSKERPSHYSTRQMATSMKTSTQRSDLDGMASSGSMRKPTTKLQLPSSALLDRSGWSVDSSEGGHSSQRKRDMQAFKNHDSSDESGHLEPSNLPPGQARGLTSDAARTGPRLPVRADSPALTVRALDDIVRRLDNAVTRLGQSTQHDDTVRSRGSDRPILVSTPRRSSRPRVSGSSQQRRQTSAIPGGGSRSRSAVLNRRRSQSDRDTNMIGSRVGFRESGRTRSRLPGHTTPTGPRTRPVAGMAGNWTSSNPASLALSVPWSHTAHVLAAVRSSVAAAADRIVSAVQQLDQDVRCREHTLEGRAARAAAKAAASLTRSQSRSRLGSGAQSERQQVRKRVNNGFRGNNGVQRRRRVRRLRSGIGNQRRKLGQVRRPRRRIRSSAGTGAEGRYADMDGGDVSGSARYGGGRVGTASAGAPRTRLAPRPIGKSRPPGTQPGRRMEQRPTLSGWAGHDLEHEDGHELQQDKEGDEGQEIMVGGISRPDDLHSLVRGSHVPRIPMIPSPSTTTRLGRMPRYHTDNWLSGRVIVSDSESRAELPTFQPGGEPSASEVQPLPRGEINRTTPEFRQGLSIDTYSIPGADPSHSEGSGDGDRKWHSAVDLPSMSSVPRPWARQAPMSPPLRAMRARLGDARLQGKANSQRAGIASRREARTDALAARAAALHSAEMARMEKDSESIQRAARASHATELSRLRTDSESLVRRAQQQHASEMAHIEAKAQSLEETAQRAERRAAMERERADEAALRAAKVVAVPRDPKGAGGGMASRSLVIRRNKPSSTGAVGVRLVGLAMPSVTVRSRVGQRSTVDQQSKGGAQKSGLAQGSKMKMKMRMRRVKRKTRQGQDQDHDQQGGNAGGMYLHGIVRPIKTRSAGGGRLA